MTTFTIRQERRNAIVFHNGVSGDVKCVVHGCFQEELNPVFVVEFEDGWCDTISVQSVRFCKEEDECSE